MVVILNCKIIHDKKFKIMIFIVLFIFGLFLLKNVNSNFDENLEQTILKRNIVEYSKILKVNRITDYLSSKGIVPISLDSEKDHGIATYYLFSPLLLLSKISPSYLSVSWHIYTYMIFFIGLIFLYKLMNYMFKNDIVSLLTILLYFFSPRILIDSFNNNKDIVFMSILIIMIYFAIRFINEKNLKNGILFAFVAGFVCNVKILGIFFFGIFGVCYIINLIYTKELNKKNILLGFIVALTGFIWYIILTPAIWGSGFKLFDFISYCLTNSTNFRGQISVLYEGKYYGGLNKPIPWHYLPKLMLLTLPIITSILFILGTVILIKKFIHDKVSFKNNNYLILIGTLICFLVPFLICVFKHPDIYNGWRHFYFLNGLLFIIVGYCISEIINIKKYSINKIFYIFFAITIGFNIYYLCRYQVRNAAYYNILSGRSNLSGYYELDYYNTTGKDALNKFLKGQNEKEKIYLFGAGFNNRVISDILTNYPKYNKKIILIKYDEVEKYLKKGKTIYEMSNVVYHEDKKYKKSLIYDYKIFNSDIVKFYVLDGEVNE